MKDYDLIVIGSGPAGEMAAVEAGSLGKRVVLIEKEPVLGGAAANTGTLPSKTLRETALFLNSFKQRSLYGIDLTVSTGPINAREFLFRERHVVEKEQEKIRGRLADQKVEVITGNATFGDAHSVEIRSEDGSLRLVTGGIIVIATGSRPYRPPVFSFAGKRVFDSSTILNLETFPGSLIIVGGGVIGCEYACIFASLGVKVTLVNGGNTLLGFLDAEIRGNLEAALAAMGVNLIKPDRVVSMQEDDSQVTIEMESGKKIPGDGLLVATGRESNTGGIGLEKAGVVTGERGVIPVNSHYQTNLPHIYAAGDVIGFPALASTSIEQGRAAMEHAFLPADEVTLSPLLPYGIYTIPECSMVGETEEQLRERGADFVVGRALYADNARGLIIGEEFGMLKLLFDRPSRKLLGVHIIGEQATEIIHIGVVAMKNGADANTFLATCFNYPTLSELYKHAAYEAFGKPDVE